MSLSDDAIRREFPGLAGCLYLNTAASGLTWSGQGQAACEFYAWRERKEDLDGLVDALAQNLAAFLGTKPESVTFLGSTTEALNLVAHSITWRPGDRILVAADEFPSVLYPWQYATRFGANVETVAITDEERREHELLEALSSGARVLAVSHVHSRTGTVLDLQKLGVACTRVGALLVVDGVQGLGAIPVSLKNVDVYCSAMFKWMLAGFGIAALVVDQRARDVLEPAYRGYENPPPSKKLRYSHTNYPGVYMLNSALERLDRIGWNLIHERVAALSGRLITGLRSLGLPVMTPLHARAGIVTFPSADPTALCDALLKQRIIVAARGDAVRMSPHFYNTTGEIDEFLHVLTRL
jgi:cysteine desulfurase / selenocysteine lyase